MSTNGTPAAEQQEALEVRPAEQKEHDSVSTPNNTIIALRSYSGLADALQSGDWDARFIARGKHHTEIRLLAEHFKEMAQTLFEIADSRQVEELQRSVDRTQHLRHAPASRSEPGKQKPAIGSIADVMGLFK